jgi:hypothetical protein
VWNLDVPDETWQQMVEAWSAREEEDQREAAVRQQQEQEAQERQRLMWRALARCEACGTPLQFWERMLARTRCRKHHGKHL